MPWYGAGPIKWDGLFSRRLFTTWWRTLAEPRGLVAEALAEDYKKIIHPIPLFLFWLVLSIISTSLIEMTRQPEYWTLAEYSLSEEGYQDLYEKLGYTAEDYEADMEKGEYAEVPRHMSRIILEKTGSLRIDGLVAWLETGCGQTDLSRELRDITSREGLYIRAFYAIMAILALPVALFFAWIMHKVLAKPTLTFSQTLYLYFYFSALWAPISIIIAWAQSMAGLDQPSPLDVSALGIYGAYVVYFAFEIVIIFYFTYFFRLSHGSTIIRTFAVALLGSILDLVIIIGAATLIRTLIGLAPLF